MRQKRAPAKSAAIEEFKKKIWSYYATSAREMPWRAGKNKFLDPYQVFVSEIMLQQTQVSRVTRKFANFLKRFPTFTSLANASKSELLREWQGLGYNRRALNMQRAAQEISEKYKGELPKELESLDALAGVGKATAGALLNYAFEIPTPFIETNIRRTFIYHFFPRSRKVSDDKLLPLVELSLDIENPREWHYALMDYGTFLAQTVANPNKKSLHYSKQARFEGSKRQVRGRILRILTRQPENAHGMERAELLRALGPSDFSSDDIIENMISEGFLLKRGNRVLIAE